MPRSPAPRRRLTAVLLTVLGVLAVALCGPLPTASAAPTRGVSAVAVVSAGPVVSAAPVVSAGPVVSAAPVVPAAVTAGLAAPAVKGSASVFTGGGPARVVGGGGSASVSTSDGGSTSAFTSGGSTPGCRQGGSHHGSDPAAPVRVRTAHDQAPVLEDRLAPASLSGLDAAHGSPPVRGPAPGAPTPVELSVLRV
ncbi:hypothetical protein N4G70_17075 [Streptomyces sp. ASQP_92]|uniref:hypothetical protein n=1 Tax=Streptomyces sp. ASQP_92 TaxID=2979116 RepID=UPI0021C072F9|nr:hypothetical protein [Streptomyces sp. ASQP_92]MCT9090558.1 hypothetical protein [Streptomyces sp. ASQP_92]